MAAEYGPQCIGSDKTHSLEHAKKQSYDLTRRSSVMRKLPTIVFSFLMILSVTGLIHVSTAAATSRLVALPQGAPLKTMQGTVKVDGEKVMFVADEDNKSWEVTNPDTLKPHVGHHVEIGAHLNPDKNQLHVMSVKMVNKGEK